MINNEFDRQVKNLIQKGYPKLAGLKEVDFLKLVKPLEEKLPKKLQTPDFEEGFLPFVIVVTCDLISSENMMKTVVFNGKEGFTKLHPQSPEDFQAIEAMNIPDSPVYLLIDIDRGKETINVKPEDALKIIQGRHRIPLTIDEGIALITQFPEFLIKNNCFSLLASRTGKDQRVPAIWINANKQANLGWCWDRNPHTWLGSASAKLRIG